MIPDTDIYNERFEGIGSEICKLQNSLLLSLLIEDKKHRSISFFITTEWKWTIFPVAYIDRYTHKIPSLIIKFSHVSMCFSGITTIWAEWRKTIIVAPNLMIYNAIFSIRDHLFGHITLPIIFHLLKHC